MLARLKGQIASLSISDAFITVKIGDIMEASLHTKEAAEARSGYSVQMLRMFTEFETNLRREHQLEGIAKTRTAGRYTGKRMLQPSLALGGLILFGFRLVCPFRA